MVHLPELDPAQDARGVVHDGDVVVEVLAGHPAGVPASDVEVVEEQQGPEVGDGLVHPFVPALLTDLFAGGLAQLLVVGLALAEGLVGDLEVGHELALVEEPAPEPGAQGDGQLQPLAPDHRSALDVGIVGHLGGQAERRGQLGGQVVLRPLLGQVGVDRAARAVLGGEVRGRQHQAVPDHAREADRRPLGGGEGSGQAGQHRHQLLGGQGIRGRDPHPVGHHGPGGVEHRGLEAGAPDVDGQGEGMEGLGLGPFRTGRAASAGVVFDVGTVGGLVGAHAYKLDTTGPDRTGWSNFARRHRAGAGSVAWMTDQPWLEDACSLVDAFRAGTISPSEALEASLAAIEGSALNAVSHVDAEAAQAAARSADVSLPFGGVPVGIKELHPVAGWPYTEASLVFADRVAEVTPPWCRGCGPPGRC